MNKPNIILSLEEFKRLYVDGFDGHETVKNNLKKELQLNRIRRMMIFIKERHGE